MPNAIQSSGYTAESRKSLFPHAAYILVVEKQMNKVSRCKNPVYWMMMRTMENREDGCRTLHTQLGVQGEVKEGLPEIRSKPCRWGAGGQIIPERRKSPCKGLKVHACSESKRISMEVNRAEMGAEGWDGCGGFEACGHGGGWVLEGEGHREDVRMTGQRKR